MATEERLADLDAALKECISQISRLQEEREMELDLKEANKKLICSLVCKQDLVDSLHQQKVQLEADLDLLITRLDSLDKENAFLKCECCALERQLLQQHNNKSNRNIDVLLDRLCDLEQQNKCFKEIIQATEDESTQTQTSWPLNVLDAVLQEHQSSKRSINDLLQEIRDSLAPQICSEEETSGSDLNSSIVRIIELIEEISPVGYDDEQCPDYSVQVLRWRNSDLISVLRNLAVSCSLALNRRQGLEGFVRQLAFVLEWAVNNCITLDDASRVRDRVRKHFALDDDTSNNCENAMTQTVNKIQSEVQQENECSVETRRLCLADDDDSNELLLVVMRQQLEESRERISRLEEEMEEQIEQQKMVNEDLDTQLTVAKVKQNEMMQKVSSLEVELEEKSQCCQDLETTCLELQLQLQISLSRKGSPYLNQEQIGWEMISDCSKLALVVQETCNESEKRHYSLRDRMFADTELGETKQYTDTDVNKVLAVVPIKKKGGGFGFIRKMFLRTRKCSTSFKGTPAP